MRMRMRNRKWIRITDAALTASDLHGAAAGCQPKDAGAHARPGSHSRTGPTQLNSAVPVLGPLETPAPPETVPTRLLATGGEEPCRNRRRLGDPTDVRPIQISSVRRSCGGPCGMMRMTQCALLTPPMRAPTDGPEMMMHVQPGVAARRVVHFMY